MREHESREGEQPSVDVEAYHRHRLDRKNAMKKLEYMAGYKGHDESWALHHPHPNETPQEHLDRVFDSSNMPGFNWHPYRGRRRKRRGSETDPDTHVFSHRNLAEGAAKFVKHFHGDKFRPVVTRGNHGSAHLRLLPPRDPKDAPKTTNLKPSPRTIDALQRQSKPKLKKKDDGRIKLGKEAGVAAWTVNNTLWLRHQTPEKKLERRRKRVKQQFEMPEQKRPKRSKK
jgi:hypothetical protein